MVSSLGSDPLICPACQFSLFHLTWLKQNSSKRLVFAKLRRESIRTTRHFGIISPLDTEEHLRTFHPPLAHKLLDLALPLSEFENRWKSTDFIQLWDPPWQRPKITLTGENDQVQLVNGKQEQTPQIHWCQTKGVRSARDNKSTTYEPQRALHIFNELHSIYSCPCISPHPQRHEVRSPSDSETRNEVHCKTEAQPERQIRHRHGRHGSRLQLLWNHGNGIAWLHPERVPSNSSWRPSVQVGINPQKGRRKNTGLPESARMPNILVQQGRRWDQQWSCPWRSQAIQLNAITFSVSSEVSPLPVQATSFQAGQTNTCDSLGDSMPASESLSILHDIVSKQACGLNWVAWNTLEPASREQSQQHNIRVIVVGHSTNDSVVQSRHTWHPASLCQQAPVAQVKWYCLPPSYLTSTDSGNWWGQFDCSLDWHTSFKVVVLCSSNVANQSVTTPSNAVFDFSNIFGAYDMVRHMWPKVQNVSKQSFAFQKASKWLRARRFTQWQQNLNLWSLQHLWYPRRFELNSGLCLQPSTVIPWRQAYDWLLKAAWKATHCVTSLIIIACCSILLCLFCLCCMFLRHHAVCFFGRHRYWTTKHTKPMSPREMRARFVMALSSLEKRRRSDAISCSLHLQDSTPTNNLPHHPWIGACQTRVPGRL